MGKVAGKIRVLPRDEEVDLGELKEKIQKKISISSIKDVPIAFGLVGVEIMVTTQDSAGGFDGFVDSLNELPEIGSAEVVELSLI